MAPQRVLLRAARALGGHGVALKRGVGLCDGHVAQSPVAALSAIQRRHAWNWNPFSKPELKPEDANDPAAQERLKKHERLMEEIKRGYYWELGQVNRTKAKLFDADKELLPVVTSYPFPSFQADSLLGIEHTFDTLLRMKNQVALVAICFRNYGFKNLPSWIEPFQREFVNQPNMQVYQVNFEDKAVMKLLKFLLVNGQKSQIDPERHGKTFLRVGDHFAIREALRIENRMVGYVFLVDWKGRVRWRATGKAREDEVGLMLKCSHELLEEMRQPESRKRADMRPNSRRSSSKSKVAAESSDAKNATATEAVEPQAGGNVVP